mgnify:CR=1 FL=1
MPSSSSAIKKSRDELRILLDNIKTQVWYLSDSYTYGAVNRAHADFVGLRPEDMAYRKISCLFEPDVADLCISCNRQIFESGTALTTEEWVTDFSGSRRLLSIYKSPVFEPDGSVGYVVCSAEDITDRSAAEDALRESEAKFRLVTEKTRDVVWVLDIQSMKLVYLSPSVQQLRGFTTEEVISTPFASSIPESSRDFVLNSIRQGVEDLRSGKETPGKLHRVEYQLPHKDGHLIWVEALCSFEFNENNRLELRGVTRDISERKRDAETIARAMLASEALKMKYHVEQQERTKLARDLHDGIGQTLQGIKLQARIFEKRYALSSAVSRDIASLSSQLEMLAEELRYLSHSMRPAYLEEQTLQQALQMLCISVRNRGVNIECCLSPAVHTSIQPFIKDHIYRIAQEALSNAVRHANASKIMLELDADSSMLFLRVRDDGSGFEMAEASANGCGLEIMRERADLISATLKIESGDGGTTITVEVPLGDQNTDS